METTYYNTSKEQDYLTPRDFHPLLGLQSDVSDSEKQKILGSLLDRLKADEERRNRRRVLKSTEGKNPEWKTIE